MSDAIKHPPHYTSHPSGVEAIEITKHMNFCLGNVVKYVLRCDHKHADAVQDLKKAMQYLQYEIDRREALTNGGSLEQRVQRALRSLETG